MQHPVYFKGREDFRGGVVVFRAGSHVCRLVNQDVVSDRENYAAAADLR